MIKFNSTYSKLFLNLNKSYYYSAGVANKLNKNLEFNKFNFKNFYFQESKHGAGDYHLVAKRVIKTVGKRLRELDPHRWDGIPITFETKWLDPEAPMMDVKTCVYIHDALEREFNIDIDDKKILLGNVKDVVNFLIESHQAI